MNDFADRIRQNWEQRPFTEADLIAIGVSGGVDSMALLHCVCQEGLHPRGRIVVICVNHQLRETAAAEADLVAHTAESWGVTCVTETVDTLALKEQEKRSVEEAAREGRYRVFGQVMEAYGAAALLTAHQADDQVETVVMNLLRGSGGRGLGGMLTVSEREVSGRKVVIFRPLLTIWREEIWAYVQEHRLPYVEDASNTDQQFLRNRIRHELLPLLERYNAQAKQHIWQTAQLLRDEQEGWQQLVSREWDAVVTTIARGALRFDLRGWQRQHKSVQRTLLRVALEQSGASLQEVTFNQIEAARDLLTKGTHGTELHLPHGLRLSISYDTAVLTNTSAGVETLYDVPLLPEASGGKRPLPGTIALANGWVLDAAFLGKDKVDLEQITHNKNRWEAFLAVDPAAKLCVRPRTAGERFRPLGMSGTIKVKDVMINEKIPAAVRSRWPLVADGRGVLWLTGHRLAQRAAVTAESETVIHIKVYKQNRQEESR